MKSLILISFLTIIWMCSAVLVSPFGLCGYNEFLCISGQCIQESSRCDGFPDCSDGSDETLNDCADWVAKGVDTVLGGAKDSFAEAFDTLNDGEDSFSDARAAVGTLAGGAIAGISIGGIAILLLCCACCYCCCCRRGRDVIIQNNAGPPVTNTTVVMASPASLPMQQAVPPYTVKPYPNQ